MVWPLSIISDKLVSNLIWHRFYEILTAANKHFPHFNRCVETWLGTWPQIVHRHDTQMSQIQHIAHEWRVFLLIFLRPSMTSATSTFLLITFLLEGLFKGDLCWFCWFYLMLVLLNSVFTSTLLHYVDPAKTLVRCGKEWQARISSCWLTPSLTL